MSFPVGTGIDLVHVFSNASGVLENPSDSVCQVRMPTGESYTYRYSEGSVTRDSTGVFRRRVLLSVPGDWVYRWTGTGSYPSTSGDCTVPVDPSDFSPVY